MKLYHAAASPFVRKVVVTLHETGQVKDVEIADVQTVATAPAAEQLPTNPLGKIPALERDDGPALYDSRVICAYLDDLNETRKLVPQDSGARIRASRLQALADGLSETGILARWEAVRRPEPMRYKPLLDGLLGKLSAGYDFIEENVDLAGPITIGEIALATSLSWLEFRDLADFRGSHPKLTSWYDDFSARASMQATALSGDTQD